MLLGLVLVSVSCGGGGGSSPTPPITTPQPSLTITSIAPGTIPAGSGGFQLAVFGTGFNSSSVVLWAGSSRSTTFVSGTELRATVNAADVASAGSATVTVSNGSQTSNGLSFTITSQTSSAQVLLVSAALDGSASNGDSFTRPAISADGRYVAFQSEGTNLVSGTASGFSDIYVRDTCLGATTCTPSTIRVSVSSTGTLANGNSRTPGISANGRFVVFDSSATNLVPNDTNGTVNGVSGNADVFLRDTCIGAATGCTPSTIRVSVSSGGAEGNGDSRDATISADGRYVAFASAASNLVPSDTNGAADIFVYDTCLGAAGCVPSTSLVSLTQSGTLGNAPSARASISADGRFIAFRSFATNMVPGDTNNQVDDFVRDTCAGASGCTPTTSLVSASTAGALSNDRDDIDPSISALGRFVAFTSHGSNLVANDTNGRADVFLRDTCLGASGCSPSTIRVSVSADGSQANDGSEAPSISSNGRLVAFSSIATNLIAGGTASPKTIFLRDSCVGVSPCTPSTTLLGRSGSGSQDNGVSEFPVISADGKWVAFLSSSTNLAPGATNGKTQVLIAKTGF